jgi:hypothetical protein
VPSFSKSISATSAGAVGAKRTVERGWFHSRVTHESTRRRVLHRELRSSNSWMRVSSKWSLVEPRGNLLVIGLEHCLLRRHALDSLRRHDAEPSNSSP